MTPPASSVTDTAEAEAAPSDTAASIEQPAAEANWLDQDTTTIKKAMAQVNELASKTDAQSKNQLVRWITNKEEHAVKIQEDIARYFMAQRIKMDDPKYVEKLKAAHAVIVHAMKCKQTVDTAQADTLKAAIMAFHKAYEGK